MGIAQHQSTLAAGIDCSHASEAPIAIEPQEPAQLIPTGIALHMAESAMCALILPRSGLGHNKGQILGNGVGMIDADYTAQCFVSAWNRNPHVARTLDVALDIVPHPDDRIAQMVFLPVLRPVFVVVEDFSRPSERGQGGFGFMGGARL
jgi:dUTP pyrophosphatase